MKIDTLALEPGPNPLQGRHPPMPGVADLVGRSHLRVSSCRCWRTDPDWSIPRRAIDDTMLFMPLAGEIEVTLGRRTLMAAPGHLAVIPDNLPHAICYRPGHHRLDVLVVHVVIDDPWGPHVAHRFTDHVMTIPDWRAWAERLIDLTAWFNTDQTAADGWGRIVATHLLGDLIRAGARVTDAQGGDPRIARALTAIHADPAADHSVANLARAAGLGEVRFRTLFIAATGTTPKAYIARIRLRAAAELLRNTTGSIREIATECGFSTDHYFHQVFKQAYGLTPSAYRSAGMHL